MSRPSLASDRMPDDYDADPAAAEGRLQKALLDLNADFVEVVARPKPKGKAKCTAKLRADVAAAEAAVVAADAGEARAKGKTTGKAASKAAGKARGKAKGKAAGKAKGKVKGKAKGKAKVAGKRAAAPNDGDCDDEVAADETEEAAADETEVAAADDEAPIVKKRPAASEAVVPADTDACEELRDMLKARKFKKVFDTLPKLIKDEYDEVDEFTCSELQSSTHT